jgi:hypothetical protein
MAYLRRPLSASTNGRGIKIAATGNVGTTIHAAQSSAVLVDVITLYASNTDTVVRTVTLQWGASGTGPDDYMYFDIPPRTTVLLITDLLLQNSLTLYAFASAANVVNIFGFMNREF